MRTAGKEIPDAEKGGQAPGRPGASPRFSAGNFSSAGRLTTAGKIAGPSLEQVNCRRFAAEEAF